MKITWCSWICASWYNYENNQQYALYRLNYYSKSALHVSGDVFAHHQKHLTVFPVSGSVHPSCCRLVSRMSSTHPRHQPSIAPDDGRKHRPKHVQPTWNNKLNYIVHLVGYFHSCITMQRFMNIKLTVDCSTFSLLTRMTCVFCDHGIVNSLEAHIINVTKCTCVFSHTIFWSHCNFIRAHVLFQFRQIKTVLVSL